MQKPNVHFVKDEEFEKARDEVIKKMEQVKLRPILKNVTIIWIYVLAMIFSLITTVKFAFYLWP